MKKVRNIFSDKDFQKYNKLNEATDFVDADDIEKEADDFQDASEDLTEDVLTEETSASVEKKMSDEDLKVEALKIATNIAKLMSNVTAQDVVTIAGTVSDFIRNHEIGSAETSDDFLSDNETEETSAEEEKPEEFETKEEPEAEEFKTDDEEVSDESES